MAYDEPLKRAISAIGGPSKVAKALEIGVSAVGQWKKAPAAHVVKLAALAKMDPSELRPDMYEIPVVERASAA